MSTTYAVATPLYGNLEVHADGCQHIARLARGGGGILSDGHATAERALEVARWDDERAKVAPCAISAEYLLGGPRYEAESTLDEPEADEPQPEPVKVNPAFLSDLSVLMHDERVFIPAQDLYVALGEPALPEPEPVKPWHVLILWANNGWIDERTERPWDLPNRMRLPREDWREMPQGNGAPWTSRYVNDRGDVLVITRPGGTLD